MKSQLKKLYQNQIVSKLQYMHRQQQNNSSKRKTQTHARVCVSVHIHNVMYMVTVGDRMIHQNIYIHIQTYVLRHAKSVLLC